MSAWHLNSDQPVYTRHREAQAWGSGASLYDILGVDDATLRRSIAVHEAGHAVLNFAFGIPVDEIRIFDGLGKKDTDDPATAWVKTAGEWSVPYMRYMAMCAAGERAQDRWMREQGLWTPERAWAVERTATDDRNQVTHAARQCELEVQFGNGPARGLHYSTVQDVADAALAHLWDRVLRLAAVVDKDGHLTGREAARCAGMPHVATPAPAPEEVAA